MDYEGYFNFQTKGLDTVKGKWGCAKNGGNADAFVAKVSADDAVLIYSTFLSLGEPLTVTDPANDFLKGASHSRKTESESGRIFPRTLCERKSQSLKAEFR